jgi:hypothetical protein
MFRGVALAKCASQCGQDALAPALRVYFGFGSLADSRLSRRGGQVAQSVEQKTENLRVGSSILPLPISKLHNFITFFVSISKEDRKPNFLGTV